MGDLEAFRQVPQQTFLFAPPAASVKNVRHRKLPKSLRPCARSEVRTVGFKGLGFAVFQGCSPLA